VRRIQIVDDEPSVRDVMATLLIDAGYSVQTAADDHTTLEIIDDAPPDLIITDVMTPNLQRWRCSTTHLSGTRPFRSYS